VSRASLSLISDNPRPLWLVSLPDSEVSSTSNYQNDSLLAQLSLFYHRCAFRGVDAAKLRRVLDHGVDVDPTDSVIYVDGFDKALEYGEWPKLVIALRSDALEATFREVPVNSRTEHLVELEQRFPTALRSVDGQSLWMSRLPATDPRVGSPYEVEYARWIPGDAKAALAAVFILVRPQDVQEIGPFLEG